MKYLYNYFFLQGTGDDPLQAMYALLSFCSNDGQSGKIYRELFEPDIINVFLYAYNACHSDPEAKLTLAKIREQFSSCVGTKIVSKSSLMARSTFGTRIFSKLALHIIDKIIQRKYELCIAVSYLQLRL